MTDTLTTPTNMDSAPMAAPAKGFAITALVLGIVGIVLAFTFLLGQYGALLGALAVVFGFLAARKNKRNGHPRGVARAGMILGAIAVPLGFATAAIFMSAVDTAVESFDQDLTVLEAEWHLQGEYTDYANDLDATATAGDITDGITTVVVTETGSPKVLATHTVQINDDGTFIILD